MLSGVMLVICSLLLLVCLVVHGSTFFGIDSMEHFPYVMVLHFAVIGLAFVSVPLFNAHEPGSVKNIEQSRIWNASPRWMRMLCIATFVYALVNFASFMFLSEGGSPQKQGDKYVLSSHGDVIREITEKEFHQHQAYVVRGFSGHWLIFSMGFVTMWTGAVRDQAGVAVAPRAAVNPQIDRNSTEAVRLRDRLAPQGVSPAVAAVCLTAWLMVAFVVLYGTAPMCLWVLPILVLASVPYFRRISLRSRAGESGFETGIGCLLVFPSAFIAQRVAWHALSTIVVALHAGWSKALSGEVAVADGVKRTLTDGTMVDGRLWAGVVLIGSFLMWIFTASGMIGLMETVGRRRR